MIIAPRRDGTGECISHIVINGAALAYTNGWGFGGIFLYRGFRVQHAVDPYQFFQFLFGDYKIMFANYRSDMKSILSSWETVNITDLHTLLRLKPNSPKNNTVIHVSVPKVRLESAVGFNFHYTEENNTRPGGHIVNGNLDKYISDSFLHLLREGATCGLQASV